MRWLVAGLVLVVALLACLLVFYTLSADSCPEGAFPCFNSTLCVAQHRMCNGFPDCPMADDEHPQYCIDLQGHVEDILKALESKKSNSTMGNCSLSYVPEGCACAERAALQCKGRGLVAVPQNVSNAVTKMILANNSIQLNENSFAPYSLIKLIHLEGNSIKDLPEKIFQNLTKLRYLILLRNNLEELPVCLICNLRNLRYLWVHENKLKILNLKSWTHLQSLEWIGLNHNQLDLESETFPVLPSLKILDLAHNKITNIQKDVFENLTTLSDLDLRYNKIQYIHKEAFHQLKKLHDLDLSHNRLHSIEQETFHNLQYLSKLQLGYNPLNEVTGNLFTYLTDLTSLDLQDIEIEFIDTTMFETLNNLQFVYFKQYYYCTYAPKVPKCLPNSDGVSSFRHLLSRPIQRATVWIVAIFTCAANILVIFGRFATRDENKALSFVVRNLAVSDLLMGLYMAVIGMKDQQFRGSYNHEAHRWMSSMTCTVSGILAMISSEVSVLIVAFLSLERFMIIAVPFSGHRKLTLPTAACSLASIWIAGVVVAIVPVFHWQNTTKFYGTNGLCFPLHIDIPFLMGWQYSAFVFLGINTTVMLLMVVVYSAMFVSIVNTRTATTINVGDRDLAVRFFLIVLTDALCWAPIIVIKLLALCKVHIPGTLYAWVVVFVLPVNSALNPLLYTFTTPKYCNIIRGLIARRMRSLSSSADIHKYTESSQCSKRNVCMIPVGAYKDNRQERSTSLPLPLISPASAEETL